MQNCTRNSCALPVTEFDAVGVSIAKKLQRMHPTQAIYAESIMNQVVIRVLLGTLTDKTALLDNHAILNNSDSNTTTMLLYESSFNLIKN